MTGDKLVLGLAGMPGSGKSLVVEVAKGKGYDVVAMGDVVREEAKKRSLEPTPENIGRVMLELRREQGPAVIAERCIPRIATTTSKKVLVDGIRNLEEAEEFKKRFPSFKLIAVHASPETRFRRLFNRGRSDDPAKWEVFHDRDNRELGVGLGNAVAMAESMIINESLPAFVRFRIEQILETAEQEWTKQAYT
jgi:dephospho-CoA kinase